MSVEVEFSRAHRFVWVSFALLSIFLLGGLGYHFTPIIEGEAQVLTWAEWQVTQAVRQYTAELQRLQRDADRLAELLNRPPDPVRAQLEAENLTQELADGEPALQHPRELLLEAALTIQDWAVGVAERKVAVNALKQVVTALENAQPEE
ncbi:MAG: hypothetical protein HUU38_04970 [Anaerolineales bacterium]|nr:hypothetical protein [Anaerolineales bacterium]